MRLSESLLDAQVEICAQRNGGGASAPRSSPSCNVSVKENMHCLLLGNGLNRLSRSLDWLGLLKHLAEELGIEGPKLVDRKPLSLIFEELCATRGGVFTRAEASVKKQIAGLLANVPPDPLHAAFASLFNVILTTNYDYALEHAMHGPLFEHAPTYKETRFNLFRRVRVGAKEVWHVHGIVDRPSSIVLGYDQYSGYLQKIRMYLTEGWRPERQIENRIRLLREPGMPGFEAWPIISWVHYFLHYHLHIVGLGLDFTEIDLWWLLLHKRRRIVQQGHTFYYSIKIPEHNDQPEAPQLSTLRALGMTVVTVEASSYRAGYERVLNEVSKNIAANPTLRDLDARDEGCLAEGTVMPSIELQEASHVQSAQLALEFVRKTRKRRQSR